MARFSRDRVSNKLKRASRRLRRKGYTSQAGQMAMAAEQARLNEPTIYRPEHRIMENEASNLIAESQRLAAQPDFDYQRDIAPMRGQFFSDLANSGMTPSEQEGFRRRFEPQFEAFDKGQAAFLGVVDAQRKMREERKAANLAPIVAQRLKPLLETGVSQEQRTKGMLDILTDNPTALNNPATANLIGLFDKTTSATGASRTAPRSIALKLAEIGDEAGIQGISGLSQNEIDSYSALARGLAKQRQTIRGQKSKGAMLEFLEKHANTATKWVTGQDELTTEDLILLGALGIDPEQAKGAKGNTDDFKKQYIRSIILGSLGLNNAAQLTSQDPNTKARRRLLETGTLEELTQALNDMVFDQTQQFLSSQGASPLGTAQAKTEQRSIF